MKTEFRDCRFDCCRATGECCGCCDEVAHSRSIVMLQHRMESQNSTPTFQMLVGITFGVGGMRERGARP